MWSNKNFVDYSLGIIFTTPPQIPDSSRAIFTKYDQKPDKIPIRYFTKLKPTDLQHIDFRDVHGPELELFCQNIVAIRKSIFQTIISK